MQIEEVEPNKPRAAFVGYLMLAVLLMFLIGAAIIVGWRAHRVNKPPFSKHPTSQLILPPGKVLAGPTLS